MMHRGRWHGQGVGSRAEIEAARGTAGSVSGWRFPRVTRRRRRGRKLGIPAGVVLTALLVGGVSPVQAERIQVVYTDGRDPEWVPVWSVDGTSYLSVNDVGRIMGATKQWLSDAQQLVLRYGGEQATLTVESPVVLVGESGYQLRSPVRLRAGVLQVPLELVTDVLPRPEGPFVRWDPSRRVLRTGREDLNVTRIAFRRFPGGIRATLNLTESLDYEFAPESVGGFRLSLKGARGSPARISRSFRSGPLKRVAATELPSGMEILFVPAEDNLESRVAVGRSPDRITVDVRRPRGLEVPEPALKPRWNMAPDEFLERYGEGRRVDLVLIDPGHGGVDTGARGPSGLEEKEVVLDIARRLEILLEDELRVDAVLTREGDEFLPLQARTEMANSLDADLFVSIHCNASRRSDVNGFEVYFQSFEMSEEEQLVAEFENAVLALEAGGGQDPDGDLPFILWDLAQNAFMSESSDLAEMIQEALRLRLPTKSRGVKQANFVVLRGAYMPSVLLECAFATNEVEEALLGTASFQEALAEGICEGIARFRQRYETGR